MIFLGFCKQNKITIKKGKGGFSIFFPEENMTKKNHFMQSKKFIHKNLCNDVFLHFLHKKEKNLKIALKEECNFF